MPEEYLLVIDGKPQGPFSIQKLKDMRIKPADFVKTAAMIDYKEAHEIAELRELFGFKQQSVAPQYFGGFDQRLMAWALDMFFAMACCIVLAAPGIFAIDNQQTRILIAIAIPGVAVAANFVYHVVMECSTRQATFGKQIVKLRVCDMEGRRIGFWRSLWRNAAKICSSATLCVGYLMSFFNSKQQCLHDLMAETLVMKDRLF